MDNPNRNQNPGDPKPPGGAPAGYPRGAFIWMVFILLAVGLFVMLGKGYSHAQKISASEFLANLKEGNVAKVELGSEGTITGEFKSTEGMKSDAGKQFTTEYNIENYKDLEKELREKNVSFNYTNNDNMILRTVVSLLPWVLFIGLFWFFVVRLLRGAGGGNGMLGNFGRSRHRVTTKEHTNITFADVAGVEEAKEEVEEIIAFLKNPKKFQRLGGRIPRGVLLVGPPGTGKTLLAKAIAGEADVPFFSISGSDFVEMFVGVGASRVRDLFKQAKENSPCIIFLDEIDAVGRRRGGPGFNGGGHDEREQTLNAILVEMDGFETSDQVIVIAATNRSDVLDPALTRPGRFDRQIQVPLPDIEGRLAILKVHARRVKMSPAADLHALARGTPMFSGADLAAIINEAAIAATMTNKDSIEQADLEEARDKVCWGRARKSRVIDEREKAHTAYHEAGHALASCLIDQAEPLHKVSIIPRGDALGATFYLPEMDRYTHTRTRLTAEIKVLFAGRIAEQIFCNDVSTGPANDIRRATELARRMVCDWGMSDALGPIRYSHDEGGGVWEAVGGKEYSDTTANAIDREIKLIVSTAYAETEKLLNDNRDKLEAIAKALLKYETLSADDVNKLNRGQTLDRPTVGDLLDAERKRLNVAPPGPESLPGYQGGLGPGPVPQPG
ncbi:MAG: ATP-dependent zinc metalloprotease FtsH [Phycisphaerae bacterium]|nr:ATP-dependent zinc metalloprotease FtsH [Phycisphaerae bacterium]